MTEPHHEFVAAFLRSLTAAEQVEWDLLLSNGISQERTLALIRGARSGAGIRLATGRWIHFTYLTQHSTYGGLIEGVPSRRLNQNMIDRALDKARTFGPGRVALIPPVVTPFDGPQRELDEPPRFYERLPATTCFGQFRSDVIGDPYETYSCLGIVWFQDSFALPIAVEIEAAIRQLDWDQLAADVSD